MKQNVNYLEVCLMFSGEFTIYCYLVKYSVAFNFIMLVGMLLSSNIYLLIFYLLGLSISDNRMLNYQL